MLGGGGLIDSVYRDYYAVGGGRLIDNIYRDNHAAQGLPCWGGGGSLTISS